MARKAICPKNPDHKFFVTVAYVSEDWIVDGNGEFQDIEHRYPWEATRQVLHKPDFDNVWTCRECGTEAKIIEIRPYKVGDRVWWTDPGEGFASGPGKLVSMQHDPPEDDSVISLKLDSGSEAEVLVHEIVHYDIPLKMKKRCAKPRRARKVTRR